MILLSGKTIPLRGFRVRSLSTPLGKLLRESAVVTGVCDHFGHGAAGACTAAHRDGAKAGVPCPVSRDG